ncbi:hypothetical protein EOL96_06260 [Candidatus Saccharibacteria bacterium]|nr:hypothetical protein [Candidatus Saccharibacteria bacterium]
MANSKKTTTVEEAESAPKPVQHKGWNTSRVFWGLLLVLVGLLLLLDNFGVLEVQYENLWQLWPLLIVVWGVSLLNIKGTWWGIVSAILMLASFALLALTAVGTVPLRMEEDGLQSQQVEKTSSTTERLDVNLETGAGKLFIGSRDSDVPVEAVLRSDSMALNVDSRNDGNTQIVDVSTEGRRMWWFGNFRNDLDVQLTRLLPVDLQVKVGASDLDADVSEVMLERLVVDLGASSGVVKLGDRVDTIDVTVKAGASSLTLQVPEDSGVSVKLDKGVSSQTLDGLQDKGNGVYETDGFADASKKIVIQGDIGATSFTLERY